MTIRQANESALEHLSFQQLVSAQPHVNCVWFKKKRSKNAERERCGKKLSAVNVQNIRRQLADLLSGRAHSEADRLHLLGELARYLLCGRTHHRGQELKAVYDGMATRWTEEFAELDLKAFLVDSLDPTPKATSKEREPTKPGPLKRAKSTKGKTPKLAGWKRTTSDDRITMYDAAMEDPSKEFASAAAPRTPERTRPSSFIPFNPRLPVCPTYRAQYINLKICEFLNKPVTPKKGVELGHLYIFTRNCDPGYVKIGYTSDEPEQRIARWQQECSYEAQYQFSTIKFANAYQVEQLVHRELEAVRVRERVCKHGKMKCEKEHAEWFKIEIEGAKQVIKRWVKWALGLQSELPQASDNCLAAGGSSSATTTKDHSTPWPRGRLSLQDDWKTLLEEYTGALDDGHHDPHIWEKWARKEKLRESPFPDPPIEISCCEPSFASPPSQDALIKQILALSQMQLSLAERLSGASPVERAQVVESITSLQSATLSVPEPTTPLPQTPARRRIISDTTPEPASPSSVKLCPTIESPPELVWDMSSPSPSPLSDPFCPPTPSPGPQSSVSGFKYSCSVSTNA